MIKQTFCLLLPLFVFVSCQQADTAENHRLEKSKSDQIDSLGFRYLKLNRFSGTIVVAENGQIVYEKSFGFADYENTMSFSSKTAFKVGSITQIVTSAIINQLAQQGNIKLKQKVSLYLPKYKSEATIAQLLAQGSDEAYRLLGRIIEKVTDKTFQEIIAQYSKELSLDNTYFQKIDSTRAVGYLYHNYRGNGLELQKSPTYDLKEMYSAQGLKSTAHDLVKILKTSTQDYDIAGYLEEDGFSYSLVHDSEKETSIVVLSNRRHPVAIEISSSIQAILRGASYQMPLLRESVEIHPSLLKDYVGHYTLNENVNFDVTISSDSLFVQLGPTIVHLIPQSSNQFYMEQMDASMRFVRDSSGAVISIILLNGFINSDEIALRSN